MRDQKFERYNARLQFVAAYSSHYFDPYEQGANKVEWIPHMLAVKDKQSYVTWTWTCTWHVFIFVMTLLWFSIKAKLVLKLVVVFLFRGVCGEFVLFFLLLLTLAI